MKYIDSRVIGNLTLYLLPNYDVHIVVCGDTEGEIFTVSYDAVEELKKEMIKANKS